MKQPIIKTKKTSLIIYKDGYLCVNGEYIIKADLVQLDDSLMQDKINNNIPFYYQTHIKNYSEQIPDLLSLIPLWNDSLYFLKATNLYQASFNSKITVEAFFNDDTTEFIFFDMEYIKLYRDTGLPLTLRQDKKTSPAVIYNDDLECMFVVAPCMIRESFLYKLQYEMKESA